jgi:MerR family transcriptional regulator, light-induced transcriptional regulator
LLAVSATMTFHISAVEEMIKLIRSSPDIDPGLKIIVGGYPFRVAGNLWENLGADGFAVNAMDAVGLADKILASKS